MCLFIWKITLGLPEEMQSLVFWRHYHLSNLAVLLLPLNLALLSTASLTSSKNLYMCDGQYLRILSGLLSASSPPLSSPPPPSLYSPLPDSLLSSSKSSSGGSGEPGSSLFPPTGGPTHHYLEMAHYFVICFAQLIRPLLLLFLMKTQLQQK